MIGVSMKKIKIPSKIHEIISYLAHSFSSKILEREDIKQDLYVLYLETIKKKPKSKKNKPGWFFIRFKWYLLKKYAKEVKRICNEWEYLLSKSNDKSKLQSTVGYLSNSRFFRKKK